ncbi:hypothetical protein FB645_002238 [Coemansia sp. IMI 203386]|nr:hypothetical protein FB645_002238 [Coemansia sp. IMI 203386]
MTDKEDFEAALVVVKRHCYDETVHSQATLLQTWFTFCNSRTDYEDKQCDENRIIDYTKYLIDQVGGPKQHDANSHTVAVTSRLAILWTVWRTQNDRRRTPSKKLFEAELRRAREYLKRKINSLHLVGCRTTPSKQASQSASSESAYTSKKKKPDADQDPKLPPGVNYVKSGDIGEPLALYSKFGKHKTRLDGEICKLNAPQVDKQWRLFSNDTDILLNCILMRRSSYCSFNMRLWHALSISTWLSDRSIFGLTLGSLSIGRHNTPALSSGYDYITIKSQVQSKSNSPLYDTNDSVDSGTRSRRSASAEGEGKFKAEIVRHSRPIQCPWNALAMLLFYRWHILKEPLPNFKDDSWKDSPIFNNTADITDGQLLKWCPSHYEEFFKAGLGDSQPFKRVRRRTFAYLQSKIDGVPERKWILSNPSTLFVSRSLFKSGGIIDEIHMANADINQAGSIRTHAIPRCNYNVSMELADQIFPFIDSQETFTGYQGNGDESSWRESLTAFCKVLKSLRMILIQDMMLLFDVRFYRHMLRNTALMSSEIFRSTAFANSSRDIGDECWNQEVLALIKKFPQDVSLTHVKPEGTWQTPTRPLAADSASQPATAVSSQFSGKRHYMHTQDSHSQETPSRSSKRIKSTDARSDGVSALTGGLPPALFRGEVIDLDLMDSETEAPGLVEDISDSSDYTSCNGSIDGVMSQCQVRDDDTSKGQGKGKGKSKGEGMGKDKGSGFRLDAGPTTETSTIQPTTTASSPAHSQTRQQAHQSSPPANEYALGIPDSEVFRIDGFFGDENQTIDTFDVPFDTVDPKTTIATSSSPNSNDATLHTASAPASATTIATATTISTTVTPTTGQAQTANHAQDQFNNSYPEFRSTWLNSLSKDVSKTIAIENNNHFNLMNEEEMTPVNLFLNASDKLQEVLGTDNSANSTAHLSETLDKINTFMENGKQYMSYLKSVMDSQATISKKLNRIQKRQGVLESNAYSLSESRKKKKRDESDSKAIATMRTEIQLVNRIMMKVQTESEKANGMLDWIQKNLNGVLADMRKRVDFTLFSIDDTGVVCGDTIDPAETMFNNCNNSST